MDSFSSGELSADSLEYSTSTEANGTYLTKRFDVQGGKEERAGQDTGEDEA